MTTTAAATEELLLDLELRHEVQEDGLPKGQADREGPEQTDVERHLAPGGLHTGTLLSVVAVGQLIWLSGLAYGLWRLLF